MFNHPYGIGNFSAQLNAISSYDENLKNEKMKNFDI